MTDRQQLEANYERLNTQQREVADRAALIIANQFQNCAFARVHFVGEEGGMDTEYVLKPIGDNIAYIEGAFTDSDADQDVNYTIRVCANLTIKGRGAHISDLGGVFEQGWQDTATKIIGLANESFVAKPSEVAA